MKILYLVDHKRYQTKMSRGARFHTIAALRSHPEVVDIMRWGNGWQGYQRELSLPENMKWLESELSFIPDLIICYKHDDHIDVRKCPIPKALVYNEAWWPGYRAACEVEDCDAKLVICHHLNDLKQFLPSFEPARMKRQIVKEGRFWNTSRGYLVAHIQHAAKTDIFYKPPTLDREIDCLLTGVISPEVYPLRSKFEKLIKEGMIKGEIRRHPGYRMQAADECEREIQDYARHLQRAKISLVCSSVHKYALAKYPETAMAGCVVAGDVPPEYEGEGRFGEHMVRIDSEWSLQGIADKINSALENPARLSGIAEGSSEYAFEHFGMGRWTNEFVGLAKEAIGNG